MCLFDTCTSVGQPIHRLLDDRELVTVDRAGGIVEPDADAKITGSAMAWFWQLQAPGKCTVGVGTCQDRQQQLEILSAASKRTEHVDVGVGVSAADVVQVPAL